MAFQQVCQLLAFSQTFTYGTLTDTCHECVAAMTESAVALGSITEREGGGVGGGQADDGKR